MIGYSARLFAIVVHTPRLNSYSANRQDLDTGEESALTNVMIDVLELRILILDGDSICPELEYDRQFQPEH